MSTLDLYKAGSVSVTNGSDTVIGAGTAWITSVVKPGDVLFVGGDSGLIEVVDNPNLLTLATPWSGNTGSAQAYAIRRDAAGWGVNSIRELNLHTSQVIQALNAGTPVVPFDHTPTAADATLYNDGAISIDHSKTPSVWYTLKNGDWEKHNETESGYIDQEILNISNSQTLNVSPTAEYTHLYDALTEIKNRGRGIYRIKCNAGDIYHLNASTPNLVFAPGTSVYIVKSGSGDNPKMVNNHYNQSSYSVPAGRLRGLDLSIILWNIEYKSIKATLPQHAAYGWVNSEWGGKTETSIYYGNIDLDIDTFLVSTYVMSKLTIVSHGYNKLKGGGKLINNYGGLSNIIHTAWSLTVENNSKILTSLNTNTLGLSTNLLTSSEVLV